MALKRKIIVNDNRWNNNAVPPFSSLAQAEIRRQTWLKKSVPFVVTDPSVSIASGTKVWLWAIDWYFSSFRSAEPSAAAPANDDVAGRHDTARVSVTVTFQVIHLPACRGICVNPSGRFPSDLRRPPTFSLTAGTLARSNARHRRSLKPFKRVCLEFNRFDFALSDPALRCTWVCIRQCGRRVSVIRPTRERTRVIVTQNDDQEERRRDFRGRFRHTTVCIWRVDYITRQSQKAVTHARVESVMHAAAQRCLPTASVSDHCPDSPICLCPIRRTSLDYRTDYRPSRVGEMTPDHACFLRIRRSLSLPNLYIYIAYK